MRILLAIALAAAGAAAPALGAEPAKWASAPSHEDLLDVFPARALAEQVEGKSVIDCAIRSDGALADCRVLSEEPGGYGFGDAAVALAPKLRWADPKSAPARIRLPLRFDPPPPRREPVFQSSPPRFRRYGPPGPYYPEYAQRLNLGGAALIRCHLSAAGKLNDCTLQDEDPAGHGFGEAALKMAKAGWVSANPRVAEGAPVDGELVEVLVPFKLPKPGPASH